MLSTVFRTKGRKQKNMDLGHIQDVDHIELEPDGLPDGVPGDSTCLGHTSVVQDFLSAG